jgi:type IV pilus assembly protein PilC
METGSLRDVMREVREAIKGGSTMSEAFGKFPRIFPSLYIASIRAGERTGELAVTLGRYIAYQKRVETLKAKVRSASFYPALLSVAVTVVLAFLILYVIPSFTQIYADAKVELPFLTRMLIAFSEGAVRSLPLVVPLLVVIGVALRSFLLTERGALLRDRLLLGLPFLGALLLDYALAGFCRTLGTTLTSGMPMVTALQMSRGTLNNRVLEGAMVQATRRVEEGSSFSQALEQSAVFPLIALRMIGVGETSGALAEMLADISDYYESEMERRLDRLTTLVEPVMMLSMGLLVGGIVVAMYIPIFQLAGTAR